MPGRGQLLVAAERFDRDLGDIFAIQDEITGVTLVGGLAVPLDCLGVVLRDAVALFVHDPEVVLGASHALVGKRTHKPQCGRIGPCRVLEVRRTFSP